MRRTRRRRHHRPWTQLAQGLAAIWVLLVTVVMLPVALGKLLTMILSPFLNETTVKSISIAAALLMAALIAWQILSAVRDNLRKRREAKRIRDGLCRKCGYDIRESAERCPECGAMIVRYNIPKMVRKNVMPDS